MSITRISSACAVAGALVLLAGCGSSSNPSSSNSSSGTSSATAAGSTATASSGTPAASPPATVAPATVVQLKKIVLRAGDLPSSWKAAPAQPDTDTSDQAQLMRCIGAKNTDKDQVATAKSNDYALGDASISSSASSYKSKSDLDSDVALLKSPKLTPCFNQLLKKQLATALPSGAALGAVSVKFTPGPGAGPANMAGSGLATVSVTANGQHVKVYVNFAYLTGPLIEAEVDAENIGSPVPAAVLQSAVKAVADRAAAAHG